MKKYYIGLAIIALVVLGLSGFTIAQGASARSDKITQRRTQEIAKDLNSYISKERKIPESLDEAGIKDVPKTIRYSKKSSSTYEFCATYKKASDGFSGGGIGSIVTGSALTGLSSGSSFYDDYESSYTPSSLYPPYSHKQGDNCQTVKPYLSSSSYFDDYDLLQNRSSSSSNKSSSSTANDTERQTDIKALHGQIEAYYAANGEYPRYSDLASSTWRTTNLKGLDREALKDPAGSSYTLMSRPTKNYYSYEAKSSTGGPCVSDATTCDSYVLTAYLSNGTTYTKNSLN